MRATSKNKRQGNPTVTSSHDTCVSLKKLHSNAPRTLQLTAGLRVCSAPAYRQVTVRYLVNNQSIYSFQFSDQSSTFLQFIMRRIQMCLAVFQSNPPDIHGDLPLKLMSNSWISPGGGTAVKLRGCEPWKRFNLWSDINSPCECSVHYFLTDNSNRVSVDTNLQTHTHWGASTCLHTHPVGCNARLFRSVSPKEKFG